MKNFDNVCFLGRFQIMGLILKLVDANPFKNLSIK
jgi:hypothetical protein